MDKDLLIHHKPLILGWLKRIKLENGRQNAVQNAKNKVTSQTITISPLRHLAGGLSLVPFVPSYS